MPSNKCSNNEFSEFLNGEYERSCSLDQFFIS